MNIAWGDDPRVRARQDRQLDRTVFFLLAAAALVAFSILGLIAAFLVTGSYPVLSEVGLGRMLSDAEWGPRENQFNLAPMLVASLLLTGGALLLTTPISVGFAVYCTFYCKRRTAAALLRLVDISAGMPTVIYGFWGLVVLVPLISELAAPGTSMLAGILVLSLMIFPTITVVAHSAIQAVPGSYIYASTALGVSRASTILHIVFRHASAGILAAVTLGAARAIGETVVVLMVCGNVVQMPASFFDPVRTLTANIALEMPYALGMHQSALYATGLMVLLVVTFLVMVSEIYSRRQQWETSK